MIDFEGKLVVVTAPSGAGKTTIVRHLLNTFDFLDFSVSATTRPRRSYEVEGKDYFFIDTDRFKTLISEDAFAEYEMVYENQYYGTLHSEMDRIWGEKKHIIFDIDVQGALALKKTFDERCLTIFIKPPSKELLMERLINRKTDSPDSIQKRIIKAEHELKFEPLFDFILFNDDLEVACTEAELVVRRFLIPVV